jgi:heterodisulfide reductase subunit A
MRTMIKAIIDGREIQVKREMTILEAAEKLGIQIPTLCYHKALTPYGACRLCTVEVIRDGWSRLVTSCNYPIREEIEIKTDSERVIKGRKMIVELLLARCPSVGVIRNLAAEMGIEKTRFEEEDETCYLCGLCVRVCQKLIGANAISLVSRGVDREVSTAFHRFSDDCIACGACAFVCPTGAIKLEEITAKKPLPLSSAFNMGLSPRGNVYIPFPQAVPLVPVIDRTNCLHFLTDTCGACEKFCEAGAINYEQDDEIVELDLEAIIVATGFDQFDPKLKPEFGYGIYDNVITGLEFERLSSASGPTQGEILINGKKPKDVVFIHCVGSRDKNLGNEYCSRVCCMYTAKQAHLVREKLPEANITVFYMDVRAFGKGFEEFYDRVRMEGVRYRRGNPSEIYKKGDPSTSSGQGKLIVRAEDTLLSEPLEVEADLVVLATGVVPREDAQELANLLGLSRSPDGFFQEAHPKLHPVETSIEGIYLAGCCQGPKDVPDAVTQGKAAASSAIVMLSKMKR